MEEKHISSFTGKFKSEKLPTSHKAIKEFIESFLNLSESNTTVSFRGGILYIKSSPVIKQEIFLKKKKIIKLLNESGLLKGVKDLI